MTFQLNFLLLFFCFYGQQRAKIASSNNGDEKMWKIPQNIRCERFSSASFRSLIRFWLKPCLSIKATRRENLENRYRFIFLYTKTSCRSFNVINQVFNLLWCWVICPISITKGQVCWMEFQTFCFLVVVSMWLNIEIKCLIFVRSETSERRLVWGGMKISRVGERDNISWLKFEISIKMWQTFDVLKSFWLA